MLSSLALLQAVLLVVTGRGPTRVLGVVDYPQSLDEVVKLSEACKARHARLIVVVFRNAPLAPPWSALLLGLSAKLAGADTPYLDLGQTLRRNHDADDLIVHRLDRNPNEMAHRAAADEIRRS